MSQIKSTSRRSDKASLKDTSASIKMKEITSSKDELPSTKMKERPSSKDALTSSKLKERVDRESSVDALPSSKLKERVDRVSSKGELLYPKMKEREDKVSSKGALSSLQMKERFHTVSSKSEIPSPKMKERIDIESSKGGLPSSKIKERFEKLTSKDATPFATKTKSDILRSPPEGLPSWLTAEDIVQIINLIQERELTRVSREQASLVLETVMTRGSEDVNEERMDKLLSHVGGLEESEDLRDSKRKKSDRKEQKIHGKKGRISERKSKERSSWNIVTALRRPRITTGSKASDFQTTKNYETYKEAKDSDVCFGCERNFTNDLLRLCPVCKQVKFCSAECFWKSRKNNSHKCPGDIFPDWKNVSGHSEYDGKDGDSHKKNKKTSKKNSLHVLPKNNDALENKLYKSEFKNRLEKDWKNTKNVMSGRKASRH